MPDGVARLREHHVIAGFEALDAEFANALVVNESFYTPAVREEGSTEGETPLYKVRTRSLTEPDRTWRLFGRETLGSCGRNIAFTKKTLCMHMRVLRGCLIVAQRCDSVLINIAETCTHRQKDATGADHVCTHARVVAAPATRSARLLSALLGPGHLEAQENVSQCGERSECVASDLSIIDAVCTCKCAVHVPAFMYIAAEGMLCTSQQDPASSLCTSLKRNVRKRVCFHWALHSSRFFHSVCAYACAHLQTR
jgi:hypothetical protein